MTRAVACLLCLAAVVAAGEAVLVDGRVLHGIDLEKGDTTTLHFARAGKTLDLPTTGVVSIVLTPGQLFGSPGPFNLYLFNGDRVRGPVHGAGNVLTLREPGLAGLEVALDRVRAVRFGRLVGALQARYNEAFEHALDRDRDVVIVERGTRPFPIPARVLAVGPETLTVRVGDQRRELEIAKVFAFVRTPGAEQVPVRGMQARMLLGGGGRITLPLREITASEVRGPSGTVKLRVARQTQGKQRIVPFVHEVEFLGEHLAQLSGLDPIDVKQTALFGAPPRWRRDAMVYGGGLRVGGASYARGLGVQAYARIEFALHGRWRTFFVRCGIDDAAGPEGKATFRVLGDGKLLGEVVRRRGQPAAPLLLDIGGVDRLVLEADPGASYISDFCDWAEARVFTAPPMQKPPRRGQ